jgi:hypothetical protein
MSKYTTEVRYICESSAGLVESVGYASINDILEKCVSDVFNFDFPVFDESYRKPLEKKILKHFYTREIGFESVGLWKLKLDTKMNEIMPYFNQLYKSELLSFNPLYDVDFQTTHTLNRNESAKKDNTGKSTTDRTGRSTSDTNVDTTSTSTGSNNTEVNSETNGVINHNNERNESVNGTTTTTGETKGTDTNTEMYSETPQGSIENLETGRYLTNAKKTLGSSTATNTGTDTENRSSTHSETTHETNDSTTESTTESTTRDTTTGNTSTNFTSENSGNDTTNTSFNETNNITSTDDYIQHIVGKTSGQTYSKMLQEFRETFMNIDMLVIESLEPLFMQLW